MPSVTQAALEQRLSELGERAAAGSGIEVANVELRGAGKARLLRVFIDKPGGVTHADCELISHRLGQLLDETDVIEGDSYTLEVSSPGVDRPLKKPRDFERVVGQKIRLKLRQPVNEPAQNGLGIKRAAQGSADSLPCLAAGRSRALCAVAAGNRLEGKLLGMAGETITVEVPSGDQVQVPLGDIEKANLKFEW